MSVLLQLPANIMTFGVIYPHPKKTKYEKGPCPRGGKIADWGRERSKRA